MRLLLALLAGGCVTAEAEEDYDELGAVMGSLEVDTCDEASADIHVPWGPGYDGHAIVNVEACQNDGRCDDLSHWYKNDGVVVPCHPYHTLIRIVWVAESSPF